MIYVLNWSLKFQRLPRVLRKKNSELESFCRQIIHLVYSDTKKMCAQPSQLKVKTFFDKLFNIFDTIVRGSFRILWKTNNEKHFVNDLFKGKFRL